MEAGTGLPCGGKECSDGFASAEPLQPWRHDGGCILLEHSHKAVHIVAFPGMEIAAKEPLLFGSWLGLKWGPTVRVAVGERVARSLQSTVDGCGGTAKQSCCLSRRPAKDIA